VDDLKIFKIFNGEPLLFKEHMLGFEQMFKIHFEIYFKIHLSKEERA